MKHKNRHKYFCVKILVRRGVVVDDFSAFMFGVETRGRWRLIVRAARFLLFLSTFKSTSGFCIRLVVVDKPVVGVVSFSLL